MQHDMGFQTVIRSASLVTPPVVVMSTGLSTLRLKLPGNKTAEGP